MSKGPQEDDKSLFRQAMHNVTPLRTSERVVHAPAPVPANVELRRQRASIASQPAGTPLSDFQYDPATPSNAFYRVNGVSSDVLRRLRKEEHAIRATLDLHGMNVDQAREHLARFIDHCCAQHYKRVRVIHGQGFGSSSGASILRLQTRHWLSQMPQVLGYVSPGVSSGGDGAVLVLLRSAQKIDHA